ncbi:MAG: tryptophan--tRNA ligase [Candidatus Nanopelagicales bacterium]|jgi:tryptophanyl-tRNA synthetase|nr:tryptophan--tRNA ligase [Candidatus Nanopelagicales bacterium]MDP4986334.1 tryptophan--tRNA ligase [Candidatus Nanopelagicales bacterium]
MAKPSVLSGIQPTADSFHIGNYFGALRQWVSMQETHDCFYSVVDLHAITSEFDPKVLKKRTLTSFAQLLAVGIDTNKSTIFVQSQVPQHAQLAWVLSCFTGFGEAGRMTQFKDKTQKGGQERSSVGLFTYPILQAADILLYQAQSVPVGEDQRQHLELTRDLANRFNNQFGKTFIVPEAFIVKESAKILDLQDPSAKMSKSSPQGCVFILDEPDVVMKKFKTALTDSGKEIKYDPVNKPGVSNLLGIIKAITSEEMSLVESQFVNKGYGDLKTYTGELVVEKIIKPFREKTLSLLGNEKELSTLMTQGAQKAEKVAANTLRNVYEKVGF